MFVSSTLQELAPERAAVRAAIGELHLTPVWFEHGARPHPPEALYRACLEQSQVFVGIYWQSYGWLAPGAEVSGIEHEYRLAQAMPRLLYLKEPASRREPRLAALLESFNDDRATYTTFGTAEELRALVVADLALLLSDRFDTGDQAVRARLGAVPTPATSFVDRVRELERVECLLLKEGARLVTLSGPGGIGKTRLAVETARQVAGRFADGVVFVPLDGIADSELVWPTVAVAAGMREATNDPLGALAAHLRGREVLLLVDNFEHVIAAAAGLGSLLKRPPRVAALVTSGELLQLRAEHEVAVPPLAPAQEAVVLFGERAAAASHAFNLAADDLPIVAEICRRLDGVPLAIDLAAPRLRLLTSTQLLERLRERLALAAPRDTPERQQTLAAAIGWSYELLSPVERSFKQLGAFRGSFVLEAAEAACELPPDVDLLELLSSLLDKSIVYRVTPDRTRFAMLGMFRDFAQERLRLRGELNPTLQRMCRFYLGAAGEAERNSARSISAAGSTSWTRRRTTSASSSPGWRNIGAEPSWRGCCAASGPGTGYEPSWTSAGTGAAARSHATGSPTAIARLGRGDRRDAGHPPRRLRGRLRAPRSTARTKLREQLRATLGEHEFGAATARGRVRPHDELVPADRESISTT